MPRRRKALSAAALGAAALQASSGAALVLPSVGHYTAEMMPGRACRFKGVGHAPFWEDAPRFNRELASSDAAASGAAAAGCDRRDGPDGHEADAYDRAAESLGNVVELQHVNLRVPDQQAARPSTSAASA